ncbi:DUF3093 domain-containing protein [Nocardioides sp. DS6]|uniref:DUF3093 domain-containing protein n=1 Tax=Nocardioides eburneus TaxID=3231482 RepID=A0ABV3SVV0_9ACTN
MSTPAYDERLHVPLRWWVQGVMFLATVWIAVILWVPEGLAWGITAALVALFVTAMLAYGSPRITVVDGVLHAGRARIEAAYVGAAEPLDAEAARRVAGREADARAFLLLRPYLKRAVKVEITDPADPAPYWLLATRHPRSLADAIAGLAGRPADSSH